MDIIWNNPEVDQAIFFTEDAFKKYSHEPSLREHLCAKAAELEPGLDLLAPPPEPTPPVEQQEPTTKANEVKIEGQDEKSAKREEADINEFQRIARQRLEAWRKAAAGSASPSTSQSSGAEEITPPCGDKGKPGNVEKKTMWVESGKPEPIEEERLAGKKKPFLPMKGKACEVPYPQFSCLNKVEQASYMKLYTRFQKSFPANPSPEQMKEIQTFKEMQVKVIKEQKLYMEHLENAAKSTPEDYKFMHAEAVRYMETYFEAGRRRVHHYPRYYVQLDSIPLLPPRILRDPPSFRHKQNLLEMGVVPSIIMPAIGSKHGRPHVPLDASRIQQRFPTHPPDNPDVWNKPACSRDPNIEKLTKKYKPQVVMSSSALRCLIDNHAPGLERNWELPFVIKEFTEIEDGEEYMQRVIYIDKPFPPKILTTRDKNLWYHRFGLKTILQHPFHLRAFDLEKRSDVGDTEQGASAKQLTAGVKQELVSGKMEDSLFGMVDTTSQDTFGTAAPGRKKSVFSFINSPKSDTKNKPNLIKFTSGGTMQGSEPEAAEKPPEGSASPESVAAPMAEIPEETPKQALVESKCESAAKKREFEENEKAFFRRESEGFIVGLHPDEDSRSSTESRSPQAHVRSTRSRAGSPKGPALPLPKESDVKQNFFVPSDTDTSDEEDKLLIDIPDGSPTRLTRSSSKAATKKSISAGPDNVNHGRVTRGRSSSDVTSNTSPKATPDTITKKRSSSFDTNDHVPRDEQVGFKSPPKITRTSQAVDCCGPSVRVTRRASLLDIVSPPREDSEGQDGKVKTRRLSGQAKRSSGEENADDGSKRKSLRSDSSNDVVMEDAVNEEPVTEEKSCDMGAKKRITTRSSIGTSVSSDNKQTEAMSVENTKSGRLLQGDNKSSVTTGPTKVKAATKGVLVKSPLDDILKAQNKLHELGKGQGQSAPGVGAPVSTAGEAELPGKPQGSVPSCMSLEDPANYQPLARHNVLYNMWMLGEIPVLLRSSYHGHERNRKKKRRYVSLLPKLEYQPHCGYERETISEVSRAWLAMYTRKNSKVIRARVNVFNSEVMLFDNLELQQLLHPQSPFNPQAYITVLHGIMERLTKLPVGSYLLSHTSGNSHCHIKKSVDTNVGVYDLHVAYASTQTYDDPHNVPWIPIDPTRLMPFHNNHGRIPATFIPPDPDRVQNKKKKKKKNYKPRKD